MYFFKKESELSKARKLLLQQHSIIDLDFLLKEIDKLLNQERIALPEIKNLIILLQTNCDNNDYLNRKNLCRPIEYLEKIPPIYLALNILLDLAQTIIERQIVQHFKDNELHLEDEELQETLLMERVKLITYDDNKDVFTFWNDNMRHYHLYPNELYPYNKSIYDRLDVDLILRKLHYSVLPLVDAIYLHSIDTQVQPGYVTVATDEAVQYDSKIGRCNYLLDPHFKVGSGKEKWKHSNKVIANPGNYPFRLIATNIIKCHIVLVRDNQNRFFMLHVSPSSLTGAPASMFAEDIAKKSYIDLHPNYEDQTLGLQEGDIDVIVIDSFGFFNPKKFEASLPPGVKLNQLEIYGVKFENELPFSVCFLPEQNKLLRMSYNSKKITEYTNVFERKQSQFNKCIIS